MTQSCAYGLVRQVDLLPAVPSIDTDQSAAYESLDEKNIYEN